MAKLGSIPQHSTNGQSDVVVSLCSLGLMLCMVIVVLGIKLRWFKKRIHFDQIPNESSGSSDNGQVVLRRSSRNFQEQFSEPVVVQGIFRKKLEEDVILERPKTLPPIRIRKSSKAMITFAPPKRNEIPTTVVEEPVVIPPPPPPLPPSASSLSLSSLSRTATQPPPTEDKVNFAPSVEIIPNGNSNIEIEPLNTEEAHMSRQLSGRKQTGYTRPSDEIIAELQKLSDEVTKKQNFQNEPPEPLPRSIITENHKFKKNTSKTIKYSTDSHTPEDEQIDTRKLGHRRLTGIFPSADEDLADHIDTSDDDDDEDSRKKQSNKVIFKVNDTDDDRKSPSPPPIRSPPPPRILFITQVSNNDEDLEESDTWSAIQRHRTLTQEINDQKEITPPKEELYAVPKVEHPPATQPTDQPKPRTMRDMKRNNARNDLLLHSEKDYVET